MARGKHRTSRLQKTSPDSKILQAQRLQIFQRMQVVCGCDLWVWMWLCIFSFFHTIIDAHTHTSHPTVASLLLVRTLIVAADSNIVSFGQKRLSFSISLFSSILYYYICIHIFMDRPYTNNHNGLKQCRAQLIYVSANPNT